MKTLTSFLMLCCCLLLMAASQAQERITLADGSVLNVFMVAPEIESDAGLSASDTHGRWAG